MKTRIKKALLCALIFPAILASCSKNNSGEQKGDDESVSSYGLFVSAGDPEGNYILTSSSLTEGSLSLSGAGTEVTGKLDYNVYLKGGYYYHLNTEGKLGKFELVNGKLVEVASAPMTAISLLREPIWLDDNTMLVLDQARNGQTVELQYAKIDVRTMSVSGSGKKKIMDIPATGYNSLRVGGQRLIDGKLYIYFSFNYGWVAGDNPAPAFLATLSYPALDNLTLTSDTRSTWPGVNAGYMSNSFEDESQNIYTLAMPGFGMANFPNKLPTAIMRIKKGASEFDKDYFFNIKEKIGEHAYGLWYIGKNKAIVKTEKSALIKEWGDLGGEVYELYVVDLAAQTAQKLDLPLHRGRILENVLVENGKAYLGVHSTSNGTYIWEYDPTTGNLKRGLQIQSGINYLLRLDKIK